MKVLFRCPKCGLESEIDDAINKFECPYCNRKVEYKDSCVLHTVKQNYWKTWLTIGVSYLVVDLLLIMVGIIFWNYAEEVEVLAETDAVVYSHPLRLLGVSFMLYAINSLVFSHWWEFLFCGKLSNLTGLDLLKMGLSKRWRIINAVMLSGIVGLVPLILCEVKLNEYKPQLEEACERYELQSKSEEIPKDYKKEKEGESNGKQRDTTETTEEDNNRH